MLVMTVIYRRPYISSRCTTSTSLEPASPQPPYVSDNVCQLLVSDSDLAVSKTMQLLLTLVYFWLYLTASMVHARPGAARPQAASSGAGAPEMDATEELLRNSCEPHVNEPMACCR